MPGPLGTFDERQAYAEALRQAYALELARLSERLIAGEITLQEWQITMREELRRMNALQLIAGAGGDKVNVASEDWLRLGPELKKQYEYLEKFAADIASGKSAGGNLTSRAQMYAKSTYASFWRQAMPVDLPAVPGDGTTKCLTNCLCKWKIDYEYNRRGRVVAVLATWELDGGEHCPDCVDRSTKWKPLRIPVKKSFAADDLFKALAKALGIKAA